MMRIGSAVCIECIALCKIGGSRSTANPIPVMKTGVSLCNFSPRENYIGKTLFRPCTGPVRDCSEVRFLRNVFSDECQ